MNKKLASKIIVLVSFIYFIWLVITAVVEVFYNSKIFLSLKEWSIVGIILYILLLLVEVVIYISTPEKKEKETKIVSEVIKKVVCSHCKTKFTVSDTGVRPLYYTCPNCGKEGALKGRVVEGESRFIVCSNCESEIEIFDTGERPLHYECPSCHVEGVLL